MFLLDQLKIDKRIRVGYGAAFILLIFSYILTWYANKESVAQARWVMRTNAVISHLDNLASHMKDAETGARGYNITQDQSFLEPYYSSMHDVDSMYNILSEETKDNPLQQARLKAVKGFINEKYKVMGYSINYDLSDNSLTKDSILKLSYIGKDIMDSLRLRIGLMKINEQNLLDIRNEDLRSRYATMNTIIVSSLILAFLFVVFGFITYIRENEAHRKANKKIEEYQEQLRNRIHELDIANQELIEMRRTEQFAATGRIARTIAHEVRNPLTNIDLATGQIRTEMNSADDNMNMLFDMINRNSKRINQLITELLNATRFVDLRYETISINTLLDEALELAKDRIELDHVTVHKNYNKKMPGVSVDPAKIKIAFLNIIVNAIEAMKPGNKSLRISTQKENDKCVIEINDNGIGMDEATLSKLFEPYFTTKSKGNGLGLTNTQNIILNHGGTINVESKPSQGTTFTIKFNFTLVFSR
jgi:signal transduction histidine kinase